MALFKKLIPLLASALMLLFAAPARAEQVTVRFDSFDEPDPGEVCVAVNYASVHDDERSIAQELARPSTECSPEPAKLREVYERHNLGQDEKATPTATATTSGKPAAQPGSAKQPAKTLERPRMFCQANGNRSTRQAILLVYNAVLTDLNLANGVLTLQLNPDRGNQGPTQLELVGREYRPQSSLPLRLRDGSQVVSVPLIPRCVERKLALPDIVCGSSNASSTSPPPPPPSWHGWGFVGASAPAPTKAPNEKKQGWTRMAPSREQTLVVDNRGSLSEVSVERCDQLFTARWSGPVPPKRLELESDRFDFRWRTNCLSPQDTCPSAVLPGANVSCQFDTKPTKGECTYHCTGSTRFPVQVQLAFPDDSGTRSRTWNESLDTPGQLLLGYVSESQRSVLLNWNWPSAVEPKDCAEKPNDDERLDCVKKYDAEQPHHCLAQYINTSPASTALTKRRLCVQEYNRVHRKERVQGVAGDRIDYTELKTPEGTVHRVHYAANQLRIPELDCQDYISYRYVGTRGFEEQVAEVDHDGAVRLDDPNDMRTDKFALGAALGGGARVLRGAGPVALGPQAEVDVIAVMRHLRPSIEALDLEVRLAAIFGTQPYCSRQLDSPGGSACGVNDWERLPYWRFPLVVGALWQIPRSLKTDSPPLTFGLHTGVAFTSFFFSRDASKLKRPALWSSRFSFGYRASPSVSFESYIWALVGEQPIETVFDDAGIQRQGAIQGVSKASFIPGAQIRIDDVF